MEHILKEFKEVDITNYPDFHNFSKPFEMGLWVLWVAKEELGIKKLTAKQIALVIMDVMEVSINFRTIVNSFNKSKGKKIHVHKTERETSYEIMKAGKDYLNSGNDLVNVFYFESNKKFSSKRILANVILSKLKGELRIIDPYCNKKTLDVLEATGKTKIRFLTKINTIKDTRKQRSFLRDLQDFKSDYPNIKFRDYPQENIHDRYVVSDDSFVLIGYSIKDFGKKETFVTVFKNNIDLHKQLNYNFDNKWNMSKSI